MESGWWKEVVISASVLGLAGWAGWVDWRIRKIPNWLGIPALVAGLALSAALGGAPGLKSSLEGAGIGLGVLLPFVLARGLGAGDWKLMGALGAYLGPQRVIMVIPLVFFIFPALFVVILGPAVITMIRVLGHLH
ncbi:MAG: A24 family peptidase [Terriglobia bacterium]